MRSSQLLKSVTLASTMAWSPALLAGDSNVDFYGWFFGGLKSTSQGKIDTTKTDTANVCGATGPLAGNCGPAKERSYMGFGHGVHWNTTFGANFMVNEAVSGKLELGIDDDTRNAGNLIRADLWYLKVDTGNGHVTVGRHNRPFQLVSWRADWLYMAPGQKVAGQLYPWRGMGLSYDTGDMLGDFGVQFGLFNADGTQPGDKTQNGAGTSYSDQPGIDLALNYTMGEYSAAFGWTQENHPVVKDATVTPNEYEMLGASAMSLALQANMDMVDAILTYTTGNAIRRGVTKVASLNKKNKDVVTGINLWVEGKFGANKAAVFWGSESATISKDSGAVAKDLSTGKDVTEEASTMGLRLSHNWMDVDYFLEFANTVATYDSVEYMNETSYVLGLATEFKS